MPINQLLRHLAKAIRNDDLRSYRQLIRQIDNIYLISEEFDFFTPLTYAIVNGSKKITQDLLQFATINKSDQSGSNYTHFAACFKREEIFHLLVEKGINPHARNDFGLSSLHFAAFHTNAVKFLAPYMPPEHIKPFINTSRAQFFAKLSYSTLPCSGFLFATEHLLTTLLKTVKFPTEFNQNAQNIFLETAQKIQDSAPIFLENPTRSLRIIASSLIPAHRGYFIIESDENDHPKRISYCDGNMPYTLEEGCGEAVFNIDPDKMKFLSGYSHSDLETVISFLQKKRVMPHNPEDITRFYKDYLNSVLKLLVTCDPKTDEPELVESHVATKKQGRGNCALKSFTILARAVMQKAYPEMSCDLDENGNPGLGHAIYKSFKNTLIEKSIYDLVRYSHPVYKGTEFCFDAINTLTTSILPKSVLKGDLEVFKKTFKRLENNGIEVDKLLTVKNENFLIRYLNQDPQNSENIAKFCIEKGLVTKVRSPQARQIINTQNVRY